MLETVRQFAEEQLVDGGQAVEVRMAHARHFAAREADIMALWDGPRQQEAYFWLAAELANLRTAFRWAADRSDLDVAATIATLAGFLGMWVENYEPSAWAEELIELAQSIDHPRLLFVYSIAALCHFSGRIEEGVSYLSAARTATRANRIGVPYGYFSQIGAAYLSMGRADRWIEMCREEHARGGDSHASTRASLVMALSLTGLGDEALAETTRLIEDAEATRNPAALGYALLAFGYAWRDADAHRALDALRRGLRVAQESGNRANESTLAMTLGNVGVHLGEPLPALECIGLAIRNYHDAGNVSVIRGPMTTLAVLLARLGRHEPAAVILGFALSPLSATTILGADAAASLLREALGDEN